jgi:hypothetical protein
MYELLKQYEGVGSRVFSVDELKQDLWIGKDEYPRYNNFKSKVLDACQQALMEHTDIKFTYEPHGKRGKGGKILRLKFHIEENKDYIDQLTLDMFIDEQIAATEGSGYEGDDEGDDDCGDERIRFFQEACHNEFSREEILVLFDKIREHEQDSLIDDIMIYNYLNDRYNEMLRQSKKRRIDSRFGYVKSLIGIRL